MIIWRAARVESLGAGWRGAQELTAVIEGGPAEPARVAAGARVRALAYPELVGSPVVGDRVLLNCSALARGLGTGGYALVIALPDALPPDPAPGPGHMVKARYTPLQTMVLGVDEQESPHHAALVQADSLAGMPVVVSDLHSALPAIVAGARAEAAASGRAMPRIAYLMSDGGALPAWFSRSAAALTEAGWILGTITVGQAFGGELEAVSLHSGLLAAREVWQADLVVVTQGPGNLGTGTRWGFSGVAAGEAVNAAGALGGRPIAALRVSGADERSRHAGVSHHSVTSFGRLALAPSDVVLPVGPDIPEDLGVASAVEEICGAGKGRPHRAVRVATDGLSSALAESPVRLSTMGRSFDEDPTPFVAAAAAGRWSARLLGEVSGSVWHLAVAESWATIASGGDYRDSTRGASLAEVGFVHASFADQVDRVAQTWYADLAEGGAVAVELDLDAVRRAGLTLVAEPGDPADQSSERFPHLYSAITPQLTSRVLPWRGSLAGTVGAGAS